MYCIGVSGSVVISLQRKFHVSTFDTEADNQLKSQRCNDLQSHESLELNGKKPAKI